MDYFISPKVSLSLCFLTRHCFVPTGRAHQKCGVPHLLLGRPDWPESEEDL